MIITPFCTGGTVNVMVIVERNQISIRNSNTGQGYLHFTSHKCYEKHEPIFSNSAPATEN